MRNCSICKNSLPESDFYKDKKGRLGIGYECKKCVQDRAHIWYRENRERARARAKRYAQTHKVEIFAYKKRWYTENREKNLTKRRDYYLKNKIHQSQKVKAWRDAHPELVKVYYKRWAERHKEEAFDNKKRWGIRQKLNIWVQEVGRELKKSSYAMDCPVCGMRSRAIDVYLFDDRYYCTQCLLDFKETNPLIARVKFVLAKRECKQCGRLHPDVRYDTCIDCRVAKKRKYYKEGGVLSGMFSN